MHPGRGRAPCIQLASKHLAATMSTSSSKEQVNVDLKALNALLGLLGLDDIHVGSQNGGPAKAEHIQDPVEKNVEENNKKTDKCQWFLGTLRSFDADRQSGIIVTSEVKMGEEVVCHVQASHLEHDSNGLLNIQLGEDVMFPLVEDEDGQLWAWEPIIPCSRLFLGFVKSWDDTRCPGHGYLDCEGLHDLFGESIYIHGL